MEHLSPLAPAITALEDHDRSALTSALQNLSRPRTVDIAGLAAAALSRMQAASMDEWERSEVLKFVVEAGVEPGGLQPEEMEAVVTLLRTALHDEDWVVRGWAVQGLGDFAADADVEALREVAESDPHEWVRADAIDVLYELDRRLLEDVVTRALEREEADSYTYQVALLYAAAVGRAVELPAADSLLTEDEELLVRLLNTLRHLLGSAPNADSVASAMVSSLRRHNDLPPIVLEECELLSQQA